MKYILSLFICLISVKSFSQQTVKSTALNISKGADVFQIVEESKKQVSLFFSAKKNVLSVRFDENFNVIDSLTSPKPSKEYDDIVGYSLNGNKYYTYWSNSNGKEFLSQCFDYDTRNVTSKSFTIPFEKEKIIKKITVNNVFYIVSITKNTCLLNFYAIKDGNVDRKTVDLTSKRFLGRDDKMSKLWDIVSSSTNFEAPYSFQTISNESPPSLTFSANKRKLYVFGNKLLFTLDNNRRFTQTFTIDLNDFTATAQMFSQPIFPEDSGVFNADGQLMPAYHDSNSFFLKDQMIQMKINPDFMKLSVKSLDGKETKEFLINNQEISFKNSDIYQENGSVKSSRVLDKSSQLMRKINDINPSVSLYEANGKIYMVLGGVSNIQQDSAMMWGGMIGGFSGALIGAALSSNYSMNNLNSYKQRKVVYINCLFDTNFNHVDGEVKKTAFDNLRAFSEEHNKLIAPVLFKMNSSLYYAGFDNEAGTYSFYRFND